MSLVSNLFTHTHTLFSRINSHNALVLFFFIFMLIYKLVKLFIKNIPSVIKFDFVQFCFVLFFFSSLFVNNQMGKHFNCFDRIYLLQRITWNNRDFKISSEVVRLIWTGLTGSVGWFFDNKFKLKWYLQWRKFSYEKRNNIFI